MRKWMIGVLALAGSASIAAPGAMAQSEFGKPTWEGWFGIEDQYTFYTSPTDPNYNWIPPQPRARAYRPGASYFSPPGVAAPGNGGDCGEFYYWSNALGRCVDARLR